MIQRLFEAKVGDDLIVNMNRFAGTCGFPKFTKDILIPLDDSETIRSKSW